MLTVVALVAILSVSTAWGMGDDDDDSSFGRRRPRPSKCKKKKCEYDVCDEEGYQHISPTKFKSFLDDPYPVIILDAFSGDRISDNATTLTEDESLPAPFFDPADGKVKLGRKAACTSSSSNSAGFSFDRIHVKGAIPIDWRCEGSSALTLDESNNLVQNPIYDIPVAEQFAVTLEKLGISSRDDRIVVYDRAGGQNRWALIVAFMLEYFGYDNVFVVEGGLERMLSDRVFDQDGGIGTIDLGGIVPMESSTTPYDVAARYSGADVPNMSLVSTRRDDLVVPASFVADNLDNNYVDVIDVRPTFHYLGYNYPLVGSGPDWEPNTGSAIHTGASNVRSGHIPKAYSRWWQGNYRYLRNAVNITIGTDEDDMVSPDLVITDANPLVFAWFLEADQLAQLYAPFMGEQKTTVTACNEGVHAILARFVLEKILCKKNVVVYMGSHHEWVAILRYDAGEEIRTLPTTNGCDYGGDECPSDVPASEFGPASADACTPEIAAENA